LKKIYIITATKLYTVKRKKKKFYSFVVLVRYAVYLVFVSVLCNLHLYLQFQVPI